MLYTKNQGMELVHSPDRDDFALIKIRIVTPSAGQHTLVPCLSKRI